EENEQVSEVSCVSDGYQAPAGITDREGITGRISEASVGTLDPTSSATPPYLLVRDASQLQAVAAALDESRLVGLDLETTGLDPRSDRIRLLSLATDTLDNGRFTYLVDCFAVDPRPLFPLLGERCIVGHNLGFDLGFLAALGFEPGKVRDTMLLSQLL